MAEKFWSREELRKAFPEFRSWFEPQNETPPKILYHYTSAESFVKILESRSFLLGRLSAMNDSAEHSWLRDKAIASAESHQDLLRRIPEPNQEKQATLAFFDTLIAYLKGPVRSDPYCVCFSARGDLLSQWRAYADDAKGFAIGFNTNALRFLDDNPVPVVYDGEEHRKSIEQAFYLHTPEPGSPDFSQGVTFIALKAALGAYDRLMRLAMHAKNPHFSEEEEYRVIHDADRNHDALVKTDIPRIRASHDDLEPVFFVRNERILQFLKLPFRQQFKKSTIVRIVLGPKNPARSSPEVLRRLLQHLGYDDLLDQVFVSAGTLR